MDQENHMMKSSFFLSGKDAAVREERIYNKGKWGMNIYHNHMLIKN